MRKRYHRYYLEFYCSTCHNSFRWYFIFRRQALKRVLQLRRKANLTDVIELRRCKDNYAVYYLDQSPGEKVLELGGDLL